MSEIFVLVSSTFPEKEARISIKPDETVGYVKALARKELKEELEGYSWATARFGEDVKLWKQLTDDAKHGLSEGTTVLAMAPISMIPRKEQKVEPEASGDERFVGLTLDNVWKKFSKKGKDAKTALLYFDENAEKLLDHKSFLRLPAAGVAALISRDTLNVESESQVFDACIKWGTSECGKQHLKVNGENLQKVMEPFFKHIRFPVMSTEAVAAKVTLTGVLSAEQILELFTYLSQKDVVKDVQPGKNLSQFKSVPRSGQEINYWNPDDCPDKRITISDKNLTLTSPDQYLNENVGVRAKHGYSSGRHYWEITIQLYNGGGNGYNTAGVCTKECPLTGGGGYPLASQSQSQAWVVDMMRFQIISGSSHSVRSYPGYASHGDATSGVIVGFLLDLTAGTLSIYRNKTLVGTPFTGLQGKLYPCVAMGRLHRNIYVTNFKAKPPT